MKLFNIKPVLGQVFDIKFIGKEIKYERHTAKGAS